MFRKKPSEKRASAAQPSDDAAGLDAALDSLASLLRVIGRKSFDIDGTSAQAIEQACEGWARHVLLGTPPEPTRDEEGTQPAGTAQRDLRGLVRFMNGHRTKEHGYVTGSLSDLRTAIWTMIQSLRGGMTADQHADQQASEQLRKLAAALDSGSPEKIRNRANACVEVIGELISKREERHRTQVERLAEQLHELRSELERAWDEASRDELTGLANRASLDAHIERMIDVAFLFSEEMWIFMVDVDHFKQMNDRLGHPGGDAVLRKVASALVSCFPRKYDLVARYGGEEFAVILQIDTPGSESTLTERALEAVRGIELEHQGERLSVTASLGAAAQRPGETPEQWIERADRALYQAKQAGRDRAVISD